MTVRPEPRQPGALLIRDWMTRDVVALSPATSVLQARRLLATYRIRHLPVVEGGRLLGVVSERDLGVGDAGLAATLASLHSDLVTGRYRRVGTVMSAPAIVARTAETVEDASERMLAAGIGALPVIGEDGQLAGILSLVDCVRALLARRAPAPGAGRGAPGRAP